TRLEGRARVARSDRVPRGDAIHVVCHFLAVRNANIWSPTRDLLLVFRTCTDRDARWHHGELPPDSLVDVCGRVARERNSSVSSGHRGHGPGLGDGSKMECRSTRCPARPCLSGRSRAIAPVELCHYIARTAYQGHVAA